MALVSLLLRPLSEIPDLSDDEVFLIYAIDDEWNLWLLDANKVKKIPNEFVGWVARDDVASMVRSINTGMT